MSELAVSSWSLHRALGPVFPGLSLTESERIVTYPYGPGSISLLDAPATLATLGINRLEICHFHFPHLDHGYLAELRGRLSDQKVEFLTLLIDGGDISSANPAIRSRDLAFIRGWIDVAAEVGALQVRVVAGEAQPTEPGAIARSIAGLAELASYARDRRVNVITENWRALTARPESVVAILDGVGERVGLCVDFGNLVGPTKYADLAMLLSRATTIHAKAEQTSTGKVDETDFIRCLDLARGARFAGVYVLIFDGDSDEYAGLANLADMVLHST